MGYDLVWEGSLNDIGLELLRGFTPFASPGFRNLIGQTPRPTLAAPSCSGDTINRLQKDIDALRDENRQLEKNTLRWKSTSEKLSHRWETEKSELTDRFLALFNEHKAACGSSEGTGAKLRGKKAAHWRWRHRKGVWTKSGGVASRSRGRKRLRNYDNAEVNRLAVGPSLKQRANDAKPVAIMSQGSGFVNPHTGATGIYSPQRAIQQRHDDAR
ncbi:hypothetical protein ACHAW5_010142 [Stephanodiscus triporus]|uniref:Uncharacterized protein n=1 Tax=Stephanodiscus triporus TaxID=2934178 RepID=A0ABD3P154_9STRA